MCADTKSAHIFFLEKETKTVCTAKEEIAMAIYHLEAKVISRGVGRSAVAASAYMSCSRIYNDYDGIQHDYTRKQGLVYEQVLLPPQAPPEWADRSVLWNAVEEAEKTKDSRLAREIIVALPIELSKKQNISLITEFVKDNFVNDGMCADICIHDTDGHNPHAHIMLTVRPLDENGKWQSKTEKEYLCIKNGEERGFTSAEFKTAQADGWEKQYQYIVGKKKVYMPPSQAKQHGYERASKYPKSTRYGRQKPIAERWNSEEQLRIWRKNWADISNKYLGIAKSESRIDHRSNSDRGIDEQPTIHEGVSARTIEKRGGISERCEINRQIKADNKILREIKTTIKRLLETATHTVSSIANALEKLRGTMLYHRYVIKFTDKWKTAKIFEVASLKIQYDDYSNIIDKLKSKISERKNKQVEKEKTPPIKIFKHRELTQRINELSEQIEELRNEKNTILVNLKTDDIKTVKTKIDNIQKAIPVMEKNSIECSVELDNTQREYAGLKEQTKEFDSNELRKLQFESRPQVEHDTAEDLKKIYGKAFSRELYNSAKSETNKFLGEENIDDMPHSILERLEYLKQQQNEHKSEKHQYEHDDELEL